MGIEDDIRAANTGEVGTAVRRRRRARSWPSFRPATPTPAAPPPSWRSCAASWPGSSSTAPGRDTSTSSATASPPSTTTATGRRHLRARATGPSTWSCSPRDPLAAPGRWSFGDEPDPSAGHVHRLAHHPAQGRHRLAGPAGSTRPRRTSTLRPDNIGTTRATLSFLSDAGGLRRARPQGPEGSAAQRLRRRRLGDAAHARRPRRTDALLRGHRSGRRCRPWSQGPIALLGDAAYCASPISGMGTSLALTGAYVLAGELARGRDHTEAFAATRHRMRPLRRSGPTAAARHPADRQPADQARHRRPPHSGLARRRPPGDSVTDQFSARPTRSNCPTTVRPPDHAGPLR